MRRFYIALLFALPLIQVAQNLPQHINYQAILRNQNGEELAPNTAAAISFSIYNSVSDPVTSPAYVETHNINVPATKVISLKIGQGTVSGSGTFSSINWPGGEVNYLVGVNGSAVGNRQVFSSVPYALYSVSSGTSAASYSFTSNFTNNSGTVDLSNSGVTSGTYGSNAGLNSRWSTVTVDDKGRVRSASDYAANTKGDISGKLDSQYVAKLRNVPLSNLTPTVGQIMQYNGSSWGPANLPPGAQTTSLVQGNGITINGTAPLYTINAIPANIGAANGLTVVGTAPNFSLAPVTNASVGVWSTLGNSGTSGSNNWIGTNDNNPFIIRVGNVNRVFINHLSGNVGLGTLNPGYRLEVQANVANPAIYGSNPIAGNNPGAHGIWGRTISTSTLAAGVFGENAGGGSGVIGTTSATARAAIYGENFAVTSNSLAYGIHGVSNNSNPLAAAVFGENKGSGTGVIGTTNSNTAAIIGVNTTSLSALYGHGIYGATSSSTLFAAGVYGENKGLGFGLYGINTNPTASNVAGVYGLTTNTSSVNNSGVRGDGNGLNTGVLGVNVGNGIAVDGWQAGNGTGTASHAGRFRITGAGNNASALLAATNGTGAAVHGINTGVTRMAGLFEGKVKTDSLQVVGPGTPTTGAVLVARDPNGNAKWSNPVMFKANFVPFSAVNVGTGTLTLGGTVAFSSGTVFDVGGGLNITTTNMNFTAPATGYYQLKASVIVSVSPTATGNSNIFLELYNTSNTTILARDHVSNPDNAYAMFKTLQVSTIAFLQQGQIVTMRLCGNITNAGVVTTSFNPGLNNEFSGYLIR